MHCYPTMFNDIQHISDEFCGYIVPIPAKYKHKQMNVPSKWKIISKNKPTLMEEETQDALLRNKAFERPIILNVLINLRSWSV